MESRNGLLLAAAVGVGTVVAGMSMMAMSRCEASGAGKAGKAANEAEQEAKVTAPHFRLMHAGLECCIYGRQREALKDNVK